MVTLDWPILQHAAARPRIGLRRTGGCARRRRRSRQVGSRQVGRAHEKLVDVNVQLYATNRRAPHHEQAKSWFYRTMSGGETVALPLVVTTAFVRLTTNRRVLSSPLSVGTSIDYVRGWLNHTTVTVPQPTNRHLEILEHLLESTGIGGSLVTDAHLATLAIEHGAELCSFDSDFARLPGLSWMDVRTA